MEWKVKLKNVKLTKEQKLHDLIKEHCDALGL